MGDVKGVNCRRLESSQSLGLNGRDDELGELVRVELGRRQDSGQNLCEMMSVMTKERMRVLYTRVRQARSEDINHSLVTPAKFGVQEQMLPGQPSRQDTSVKFSLSHNLEGRSTGC